MELWQRMIRDSVHTVDELVEKFNIDRKAAEGLDEFFQARINPYYLSLIKYPGDPIWLQCVPDKAGLESAFTYLEQHKEIRDVIVSGGDPLMLTDTMLEKILQRLRSMPHIEIIRIGSKMPCVLPHRITDKLCSMLKKYHPLYINTHFNHPREITPESSKACEMLANAGIPVGNQMVLMKGVNDDPATVKELMQKLLRIR